MTQSLDAWWIRSFRRLFELEADGGASPSKLAARWLVLDQHVFPSARRPRWTIGFELTESIVHFLDDADIRAKDMAYARIQWASAREWLNA